MADGNQYEEIRGDCLLPPAHFLMPHPFLRTNSSIVPQPRRFHTDDDPAPAKYRHPQAIA